MKTYESLVQENSEYIQKAREMEIRFPGVQQFYSVFARHLNKPNKVKNRELARLMKRLKRKHDIFDYTRTEWNKIRKFIDKYELNSAEEMKRFMMDALDFDNELDPKTPDIDDDMDE